VYISYPIALLACARLPPVYGLSGEYLSAFPRAACDDRAVQPWASLPRLLHATRATMLAMLHDARRGTTPHGTAVSGGDAKK
jgi:hypothetical protein